MVQFAEQEIYTKDSFLIKVRKENTSYAKLFVDYELLISRMPGEFSNTVRGGVLNTFRRLSKTTKLLIIISLMAIIVVVVALFYKYSRKSKKAIERYEGELESKKSDLEELEINLEMRRKQSGDLTDFITEIRKMEPDDQQRAIKRLSLELNSQMLDDGRKDLVRANGRFYTRLNELHEGLTITERELCAVIKLGLSNKEVAAIRNIDPASVKRSKNRLAKKLGLGSAAELYEHLSAI